MPAITPRGILMGLETEYAFACRRREPGEAPDSAVALEALYELLALVRERMHTLPEQHPLGLFLENGSRFYIDCGTHPELCTPECRSPEEVVRWQLAGERMLADLVAELEKQHPELELAIRRGNIDYETGNTWGCHESYLHQSTRMELARQLVPHLVSRLIYTGAGGFDARSEELLFVLSPRVPYLRTEIGGPTSSEFERGIFHNKNEPLSGNFGRLHLICGESNASQLSNYLKLGTTALLVRLVDANLCTASSLALRSPVIAMRSLARDFDCRARVALADGRELSALQIQAEYLALLERQAGADWMPDWAPLLLRRWREVLEALERNPMDLATRLDWPIKLAIIRGEAESAGVPPHGLYRKQGFGARLCEIDMRYGELGPRGLFAELERAEVLDHALPELGDVVDAMQRAPAGGRAEARGQAIRELCEARDRHRADWDEIQDIDSGRVLDLEDPFSNTPDWRNPESSEVEELSLGSNLRSAENVSQGSNFYHALDLPAATRNFSIALRHAQRAQDADSEAYARFWLACALQDRGQLDAAAAALAPALAASDQIPSFATRVRVWTRHALVELERPAPLAELERLFATQAQVQQRGAGRTGRSRVALNEARLLGARGRFAEACDLAEWALDQRPLDDIGFGTGAYLRWVVNFALRSNQLPRARRHLEAWGALTVTGGDSYSATTLACFRAELALIEGQPQDALAHARQALARCSGAREHRCRVHACSVFLDSAIEAGEHADAPQIARELAKLLRNFRIAYLRLAGYRTLARWHRVQRKPRAVRSALREAVESARALNQAFGCPHYSAALPPIPAQRRSESRSVA